MDEEPVLARQLCQASTSGCVDRALGHVDVNTDAELVGCRSSGVERFVAARERSVDPDHPVPATANELCALLDAAARRRRHRRWWSSGIGPQLTIVLPAV